MKLNWIKLKNFRNYHDETVFFGSQLNCIEGKNAQGKTNLLEAISLLCTGTSFRTRHLTEAIQYGKPSFYLEACFIQEGIEQTLCYHYENKKKTIFYNNTSYSNYSKLIGLIPLVLLCPHHISLLEGLPVERRHFLNLYLSQSDPLYAHHLVRFTKALTHRNALLKQKSEDAIEIWEEALSVSSYYLMKKREEWTQKLAALVQKNLFLLTHFKDHLHLCYLSSFPKDSSVEAQRDLLRKKRVLDMQVGTTLCGPHRDDLMFELNNVPLKIHASEGQKRSSLSAIHFSVWELLKQLAGVTPLFAIDDFGIHLDTQRKNDLITSLKTMGQTFLSTPSSHLTEEQAHLIYIDSGKISLTEWTELRL